MAKGTYLVRTTFDEIASLADDMGFNERIIFTSEHPDELDYYDLSPSQYTYIHKEKIFHEKYFSYIIGRINGYYTLAKSISVLVEDADVDSEDVRISGIKQFLIEYYEKYMDKNKDNTVYFIVDPIRK